MKSLYLVSVEFDMVVMADDWRQAEYLARKHARDEIGNDVGFIIADPISEIEQVPEPWRDSYPYGDETSKTVREIICTTLNATN